MSGVKKNTIKKIIQQASAEGRKLFAVLIDPDKFNFNVVLECNKHKVDLIFVGGSKVKKADFVRCVKKIKKHSKIPLVIFPGDENQISNDADAILILSLISGRNPDYLIAKHINAAFAIAKAKLETIPTGYILIGSHKLSATAEVTKTEPISNNKKKLIQATAIAGELLGMSLIYLEAGSGAANAISLNTVKAVKSNLRIPLIVGGGISSVSKAKVLCKAGADIIVVGNAIEKNINLVANISKAIRQTK